MVGGLNEMDILAAIVSGTVAKLLGLLIVARNRRAKFEKVGTVSALYMYPVKSCGVVQKDEAMCTPVGLSSDGLTDRHWMVLDSADKNLDMIGAPRLTLVTSSSIGQCLRLQAPGMEPLDLPKMPDLKKAEILRFTKQYIPIVDCGPKAAQWISDFTGRKARIVFSCPELGTRDAFERIRKWSNTARQGDVTVFSYLTSYLVMTEASLGHINSQLEEPVSIVNFRPNIVIKNDIPFDEDSWRELRIGDEALFHSVEPCIRCIITTADPTTGVRNGQRQPLELLKKYRCREPYGKAPVFGSYMSLDVPGGIKVGDPVYALRDPAESQ